MIEMQRLQPEMRKLQVQYKDDRQKLNEELMAFYKEHEINPVGGCLLLVQAPIFSILYYVVQGTTREAHSSACSAGEGRLHADGQHHDGLPAQVHLRDELYQALTTSPKPEIGRSASTWRSAPGGAVRRVRKPRCLCRADRRHRPS